MTQSALILQKSAMLNLFKSSDYNSPAAFSHIFSVRLDEKSTYRNHFDLGRTRSFQLVCSVPFLNSADGLHLPRAAVHFTCFCRTQLCCSRTHVDSSNTRKSACWRGTPERTPSRSLCISSLSVYSMCDRPLHGPTSLLAELWVNVYIRGTD